MPSRPDRYAVIGHPVAHSRSPEIHAAFARQTGQTLTYDKLAAEPDAFAVTVDRFFDDGGAGLNVTLPFKQQASTYAHELSDRAARAGAVNTLARRDDGRIFGDNTDGAGLLVDLVDGLGVTIENSRILILGAGGAVRGVVPVLLGHRPAALRVANRSIDKAQALASDFTDLGSIDACPLDEISGGWDLIVNAISAGLHGDMPPLADSLLDDATAVYDMLYAAKPTPFLQWTHARRPDLPTRDGFGMLVEQAAESFALWRGIRPTTAPIIQALRPGH